MLSFRAHFRWTTATWLDNFRLSCNYSISDRCNCTCLSVSNHNSVNHWGDYSSFRSNDCIRNWQWCLRQVVDQGLDIDGFRCDLVWSHNFIKHWGNQCNDSA